MIPRERSIPQEGGDEWRYEHTCDGCAQLESECLCGVDPEDVADCSSVYHPGCRNCEER